MRLEQRCHLVMFSILSITLSAHADIQNFTDFDEWSNVVESDFATIDFTGFPDDTEITDQYSDLGVTFPEFNIIFGPSSGLPNDGWGLRGFAGDPPWSEDIPITVEFSEPVTSVAVDFPGGAQIALFDGEKMIAESDPFGFGGIGFFGGVVSDQPFDKAIISDWIGGDVFIDDLHFGPPIPAPAALSALGVAIFWTGCRRRRS